MAGDPVAARGAVCLGARGLVVGPPGTARVVLHDVNLELREGQIGVLLGGNGEGKSSLLRTLAGLWPARGGVIHPLANGPDPRQVGLILDDPERQFLAGNVIEEIALGAENLGLPGQEIRTRVEEALDLFGLRALAERNPRYISGGEQQCVLLAAAWVLRPRVLLLDDCFAFQDRTTARDTWERIRGGVQTGQFGAVLLSTHDAELATRADLVGIVSQGELRYWGTPAVLAGDLPQPVEPPLIPGLCRELGLPGTALTVEAFELLWSRETR